ncbi:hypothetical protein HGRIS_002861 [Hohenbuehelia grisea]|uniref:Uncharacterized protein n=1 Tax=Hohenbuehelia grisea TaxID=104357 RepID=A0ABR3JNW2_9AGAR
MSVLGEELLEPEGGLLGKVASLESSALPTAVLGDIPPLDEIPDNPVSSSPDPSTDDPANSPVTTESGQVTATFSPITPSPTTAPTTSASSDPPPPVLVSSSSSLSSPSSQTLLESLLTPTSTSTTLRSIAATDSRSSISLLSSFGIAGTATIGIIPPVTTFGIRPASQRIFPSESSAFSSRSSSSSSQVPTSSSTSIMDNPKKAAMVFTPVGFIGALAIGVLILFVIRMRKSRQSVGADVENAVDVRHSAGSSFLARDSHGLQESLPPVNSREALGLSTVPYMHFTDTALLRLDDSEKDFGVTSEGSPQSESEAHNIPKASSGERRGKPIHRRYTSVASLVLGSGDSGDVKRSGSNVSTSTSRTIMSGVTIVTDILSRYCPRSSPPRSEGLLREH